MSDSGKPDALNREPPEVILTDEHRVACEGTGGTLGHPRVFLEIGADGFVDCGYCDRRFQLREGASAH